MRLITLFESGTGSARFINDQYISKLWPKLSTIASTQDVPKGEKRQIAIIGDVRVMIVDGNWVKINCNEPDFVEGGNDAYYKFIPKGEVWVDATLDANVHKYVAYHELIERYLMIFHKMKYEDAHEIANDIEMSVRSQ